MAHRVSLSRAEFERRAAERGLGSQTEQARAIDVAPSIHNRALAGKRALSAEYALGVLLVVGSDQIREEIHSLFDVPATTQHQQVAS
jgi:plasmid maintenance system antidote protein VapI